MDNGLFGMGTYDGPPSGGPGNPNDPEPEDPGNPQNPAPIDHGAYLLIAAGLLIGGGYLKSKKKLA